MIVDKLKFSPPEINNCNSGIIGEKSLRQSDRLQNKLEGDFNFSISSPVTLSKTLHSAIESRDCFLSFHFYRIAFFKRAWQFAEVLPEDFAESGFGLVADAANDWRWQYVFPAAKLSVDPRSSDSAASPSSHRRRPCATSASSGRLTRRDSQGKRYSYHSL